MKEGFVYCRNKKLKVMSILFLLILLLSCLTISRVHTLDVLLVSLLFLMIVAEVYYGYCEIIIKNDKEMILLPRHFKWLGSMYFGNIIKIKRDLLKSVRVEGSGHKEKILVEYLVNSQIKSTILYKSNFKNQDAEEFLSFIQKEILPINK